MRVTITSDVENIFKGGYERVESVLQENLATCTNAIVQSLIELGEELREATDYMKALSCFDEVLLLDGENVAALEKRNIVLAQMGYDLSTKISVTKESKNMSGLCLIFD